MANYAFISNLEVHWLNKLLAWGVFLQHVTLWTLRVLEIEALLSTKNFPVFIFTLVWSKMLCYVTGFCLWYPLPSSLSMSCNRFSAILSVLNLIYSCRGNIVFAWFYNNILVTPWSCVVTVLWYIPHKTNVICSLTWEYSHNFQHFRWN
jgi:hypothetical protein